MGLILGSTILERCREAVRDVDRIDWQIEHCNSMQMNITRATSAIGGIGDGDKMAGLVAELDALQRQRAQRKRELDAELLAAHLIIREVAQRRGGRQGRVLRLHYVERLSMGMIARRMHYSPRYIKELHADGYKCASTVEAAMPAWYEDAEKERQQRGKE